MARTNIDPSESPYEMINDAVSALTYAARALIDMGDFVTARRMLSGLIAIDRPRDPMHRVKAI
jgi:hypothetical protein